MLGADIVCRVCFYVTNPFSRIQLATTSGETLVFRMSACLSALTLELFTHVTLSSLYQELSEFLISSYQSSKRLLHWLLIPWFQILKQGAAAIGLLWWRLQSLSGKINGWMFHALSVDHLFNCLHTCLRGGVARRLYRGARYWIGPGVLLSLWQPWLAC